MDELVGREKEINTLNNILESNKAEFVAVYGRRRVGKTYLIHQYLSDKGIYFECTGIKDGGLKDQLNNFIDKFQEIFYPKYELATPRSWRSAFEMLTNKFDEVPKTKKIILFFDELPWLASRKSKFLQELDYFWNTKWGRASNVKLIVCGSAASWILDNLINAKGGLHNRVTDTIRLEPFTLAETDQYLTAQKNKLSHRQVLDLYFVTGGVPYYLSKIQKNKSVAQNINDLCFTRDGLLYSEFDRLFKSLFDAYEVNLKIVKKIAEFRYGITFKDLAKKIGKTRGGRFLDRLNELEAAGFITKTLPYGRIKRDHYYCINDEYTMFYFNWIEKVKGRIPRSSTYWLKLCKSPSWNSWAGFSYEIVCRKHINKIIYALGLDGANCLVSSWKSIPRKGEKASQGAQVDLLLDRDDDAITLCEIKYSKEQFEVDKSYARNLKNKIELFQSEIKTTKQVFLALIATAGVKPNIWTEDLVDGCVDLDQLF